MGLERVAPWRAKTPVRMVLRVAVPVMLGLAAYVVVSEGPQGLLARLPILGAPAPLPVAPVPRPCRACERPAPSGRAPTEIASLTSRRVRSSRGPASWTAL